MECTTRVEFESQLAAKLKGSYRTRVSNAPEKYYHLLSTPYLDKNYNEPKKPSEKTRRV